MEKGDSRKKEDVALSMQAEKIYSFFRNKKRMPSYAEVAVLMGFKSKNAAFLLIHKLIDERLIKKDRQGKLLPVRGAEGSGTTLAVLGLVEAGFPTPAEESLLETISLDDWLIPKRERSFMLKVKGDSMKDAGICDGDMVIAERASDAPLGSIVIAELDGDWTIKFLREDQKGMYLEPANDSLPPKIRPKESLKIAAIVRGVVRKY